MASPSMIDVRRDEMKFEFSWNEFADQPHNPASRRERFRHHLRRAPGYLSLAASNLAKLLPGLRLYWKYWSDIYRRPVEMENAFALAVSPRTGENERVIELLKETGAKATLVRIPSWEVEKLSFYEEFLGLLQASGYEILIALIQRRQDVLEPAVWRVFLEECFGRFQKYCSHFEVGHAWNRAKWGVWDYREYIDLARLAVDMAPRYGVKLVGPAVIDFEFHLYPPVLSTVSFDKVSSLLYVDRKGAPENAQFGWTTARKVALLRAVIDACGVKGKECWITEVNWPLQGTGKFSPAAGKPNVSEEEQANYLVRYYILVLASGYVKRIYWWQLVAPGYGLVDSREKEWRRRPSFRAFKTMVEFLDGSIFLGKAEEREAEIFFFEKQGESHAVAWTRKKEVHCCFREQPRRVVGRDGDELPRSSSIMLTGRPAYIFF